MSLRAVRRQGSKSYHTDGFVAGQRVRQSLGTGDRQEADEACALLEARLRKRAAYGEAAIRTFEEAALDYQLAGGERRFLAPLIRHFKGRVLSTIMPGELRAAAQRIYPDAKPSTWNRQAIVPGRAIINHGASLGWCPRIVVEMFPVRRPRRRVVDRAWIDALLLTADESGDPWALRAAAAMLFMFQTATRIGATVAALPEHCDFKRRVVTLPHDKEEDWAERAITQELVIRLANLPPLARPIGWRGQETLFGYASRFTLRQAILRLAKKAGVLPVTPHQSGRHSAATHALNAKFSVRQVMDAYGWKTARLLLETYAHSEGAGRAIADRLDASVPSKARKKA